MNKTLIAALLLPCAITLKAQTEPIRIDLGQKAVVLRKMVLAKPRRTPRQKECHTAAKIKKTRG